MLVVELEIKSGSGVNGLYNQDLSEKSVVIEVGGVDNTFDEMFRSMEILADVFSTYYFEKDGATSH